MKQALTIEEAARLLGVHPNTARRLAKKGSIPAGKVGGQWRIHPDAIGILLPASSMAEKANADVSVP